MVALFFYLLSTCLLTGKLHGFGGSYADLLLSWATLKDSEMALHCRRDIWWHQKVYWPIVAAVTIINLIYQILRSIDSHMRTREEYKRELEELVEKYKKSSPLTNTQAGRLEECSNERNQTFLRFLRFKTSKKIT